MLIVMKSGQEGLVDGPTFCIFLLYIFPLHKILMKD